MAIELARDPSRRIAALISGSGTNLQALIDACNTPRLPHAHIVLVFSNRKTAYGLTRAAAADPPIPTAYIGLQPFLRAHPGATRADYDLAVARVVLEARPDIVVLAGWMHIVSEGFLEAMRGVKAAPPPSPLAPAVPERERGAGTSAGVGVGVGAGRDQDQDQDQDQGLGHDRGRGAGVYTDDVGTDLDVDVGADAAAELRAAREIPVINIHPALPGQFDGAHAMERGFEAFQRGEVDRLGVMVHRVIAEVDRGAPVIVREVNVYKGEDLKNDYEPRMHKVEWEIIVDATRQVLDEIRPVHDR